MIYYPKAVGSVKEDTKGIQDAIDLASRHGGGTVYLSAGQQYLCGSLVLRPFITLHLENGSRLMASPNLADYRKGDEPDDEHTRGVGTPVLRKPAFSFLYAYDADSVTIDGEGTIDGNCHQFVSRVNPYHCTSSLYPRPTLVYLEKCNNLRIKGVTLTNSPFWSLHTAGCDNVLVEGITIRNPLDVANSDGIDPDHCTNVRIHACHITCADDCICLKNTKGSAMYPPTKGVVISDCTLVSTSSALKIGTEGVDDFSNVLVHNCIVEASNRGISIQVRDKGSVQNVHFSHILINTRVFSPDYWGKAEAIALTSFNRDEQTVSGTIRQIYFDHIFTKGESGVLIASDGDKIHDVHFDTVHIGLEKTSKWPLAGYDYRPRFTQDGEHTKPVSAISVQGKCNLFLDRVSATIQQHAGFGPLLDAPDATVYGEVADAT